MYAKTIIIGNAGADAEYKETENGTKLAKFSVAVQDKARKDKSVTWFRVVCFGKVAEIARDYVTKGKLVMIDGRMRENRWTKEGGEVVKYWELSCDNIKLLGSSQKGTDNAVRP